MNTNNQKARLILPLLVLLFAPIGLVQAQVKVTSANPDAAPQGTVSLDVAIGGSGFNSSAAVKFLVTGTSNPGGITVKKVVFKGAKSLTATIDVADDAVVDKFDIEVTLSSGRKGKGTTLFTVQRKGGSGATVNPAFAVDPYQNYKDRVATLAADGTGVNTLTGPLIYAPNPQWSPDGRSIIYFDRLPMLLVRMDSRTGAVQATKQAEAYSLPSLDWSNGSVGACSDVLVYSGGRDARSTAYKEIDLFATNAAFSQTTRLIMSHDLDDGSVGNEADPDVDDPAWSQDGRFIVATVSNPPNLPLAQAAVLYSVNCSGNANVAVDGETPLTLSFGVPVDSWGAYAWNSSGRYIAMTVTTADMQRDLWVADLGDSSQPGYPSTAPVLYRLTGVGRPLGGGPEQVTGAGFAPGADTVAFLTNLSGSDHTDNLYTINVNTCIAALRGTGSVASGCAVNLVAQGINAHNIDWRPNWPSLLP
jgi:Tol biopolymer transport system component